MHYSPRTDSYHYTYFSPIVLRSSCVRERERVSSRMMGASCSSQRHHNHHRRRHRRHSHHDGRGDTTQDPRRHIIGGVRRFRTFPFCGVSQVRVWRLTIQCEFCLTGRSHGFDTRCMYDSNFHLIMDSVYPL